LQSYPVSNFTKLGISVLLLCGTVSILYGIYVGHDLTSWRYFSFSGTSHFTEFCVLISIIFMMDGKDVWLNTLTPNRSCSYVY